MTSVAEATEGDRERPKGWRSVPSCLRHRTHSPQGGKHDLRQIRECVAESRIPRPVRPDADVLAPHGSLWGAAGVSPFASLDPVDRRAGVSPRPLSHSRTAVGVVSASAYRPDGSQTETRGRRPSTTEVPSGADPVVAPIWMVHAWFISGSLLPHEMRDGWQDALMGTGRGREPQRTATRRPSLSLVSSAATSRAGSGQAAGGAGGDVDVPQDPIHVVAVSLLAGIAEARSPLAAELVLCGAFGAVASGLPEASDEQERLEALVLMLGRVIGHAERLASGEALALLRVCSVLGPATSSNAARGAGERGPAGGRRCGRPSMGGQVRQPGDAAGVALRGRVRVPVLDRGAV